MALTPQQCRRLSNDLKRVARRVDKILEKEVGERLAFSLVIWGSFGEDEMVQYVANANREDCARNMAKLLQDWTNGMLDLPYHERQ